jgi:hypothetical protein
VCGLRLLRWATELLRHRVLEGEREVRVEGRPREVLVAPSLTMCAGRWSVAWLGRAAAGSAVAVLCAG